jgi:hypothetical protein
MLLRLWFLDYLFLYPKTWEAISYANPLARIFAAHVDVR